MIFRFMAVAAAVLVSSLALGHHSLANSFDETKEIGFELLVENYRFINPHPYITGRLVDAADDSLVWEIEMDNKWELDNVGFDESTLVAGDVIRVTGYPSKHKTQAIFLRSLEHPRLGFRYLHNARRLFELD